MNFSDIIGYDRVKEVLSGMVSSGRVPHAIMFYENDGCGATALAEGFARLLCGGARPDIHYTFPITTSTKVKEETKHLHCDLFSQYWKELLSSNPYFLENDLPVALGYEKKSGIISVREGEAILQRISLSSMSGGWRSFIVYLPEKMNTSTANMLLKAIEEPSEGNIFMLITHSPDSVLQTISSRCQGIRIPPLSKEEVSLTLQKTFSIDEGRARTAALYAGGSVGVALRSITSAELDKEFMEIFTSLLERLLDGDILGALETGESIVALDSREKQKAFCIFALEGVRKILMLQQGMESLAGVPDGEKDFYDMCARRCKKTFPRKAMDIFSLAARNIDANVNQKILVCNMVDRLSLFIR